jgi:phage/plasmid-like protein (TIGR03299 family)
MAHNLFRDSMVYVNETPWHQLGRPIDAASSSAEFLRAGGLDWNVGLVPAPGAKKDRRGRWSRLQVMRDAVDDETERVALGMVTSRYEPLQNRDAFAFFDPLIRSGWATYEAAGALGDGETVWVQVRLRDDMEVQKDESIRRYLLLRNRHNGEGSVSIRFTPVRVVCQNTLNWAEKKSPTKANVRHSRSMHERLREVVVDSLKDEIEAFSCRAERVFKTMANKPLETSRRLELLTQLCGKVPENPPPGPLPSRRDMVEKRLREQRDVDPQAGTETIWALYNAITWAEDERARMRACKDADAAINSAWFGSGADNKTAALKVLASEAGEALDA